MSKSHVSMEQKQCIVCGIVYDSGAILLQKQLRQTLENKTVTGYGLCEDHQKLFDDGYIALVEANHNNPSKQSLKNNEADRTGNICHLRRSVADEIFNVELPKDMPMIFVEPGVIEKLQAMQEREE